MTWIVGHHKALIGALAVVAACLVPWGDVAFAQSANLSVTKADSPDPVVAGTNLTYTITATNAGPDSAQNVQLTDDIPPGTTFVSATQTSGPAFTLTTPPAGGTGTFTATAATLAAGASASFTLVVNVNANVPQGGTITNTANVTTTTTDPNGANNADTETTSVNAEADLTVTKTDNPDPVVAGTNLTYTITAINAGPSDAQNVSLSDAVPAGTTFVSASQTSGPAFTLTTPPAGGTGTFTATAATLAAGASASLTLVVNVNANTPQGATITNTANITSTTADPNAANNADTEVTAVNARADLSVTKTDSPDPVTGGTNLTYTIAVSNAGPSDAQSVALTDPIPPGTTFVSASQTSGPAFTLTTPPAGGTGTFTATAATLAAGASASFTLVVNVSTTPPSCTLTNTATASSTTTDPDPADNSDTETTQISNCADVSVTKTDTPDPVVAGANLGYSITVANAGPDSAQNVGLTDTIPANTTFVSFTAPAGWTATTPPVGGTGTVTATRPTLAPGDGPQVFTLVVNVNAATPVGAAITNSASVSTTSANANAANNSDTETTAVNRPPVAANDSLTTPEDAPLTVPAPGVLGNDTDPDPGTTLTAQLVTGPTSGTLTLNPNGSFTYTPNPDFNGTDSFTYRASDGTSTSNVATVTLTVTPVDEPPAGNTPPTVSDIGNLTIDEDTAAIIQFTVGDAQTPATSLTVAATSSNQALVPNANLRLGTAGPTGTDRTLTITPLPNQTGQTTITVTVTDAQGATTTDTFVLTVRDVAEPPAAPTATLTVQVGTSNGGSGTVASSPSGINCPPDCTETYDAGTVATLTATPARDSVPSFGGACSGTGPCTVTLDQSKTVTVTFTRPTCRTPDGRTLNATIAGTPVQGRIVVLNGTRGRDVIVGTARGDIIRGFGGDDVICANGGNDRVEAGAGNDTVDAGPGIDFVDGGDGNDLIVGGDGNDVLRGRDGDDTLRGGAGNDVLGGGPGRDRLLGEVGRDRILGEQGDDALNGGEGTDNCFRGPTRFDDTAAACEAVGDEP